MINVWDTSHNSEMLNHNNEILSHYFEKVCHYNETFFMPVGEMDFHKLHISHTHSSIVCFVLFSTLYHRVSRGSVRPDDVSALARSNVGSSRGTSALHVCLLCHKLANSNISIIRYYTVTVCGTWGSWTWWCWDICPEMTSGSSQR